MVKKRTAGGMQHFLFPTFWSEFLLLLSHWLSTPGFAAYPTLLIPLADVPSLFTT